MTEILSGVAQSFLGKAGFDQMPGNADNDWRHQHFYTQRMQTLMSGWSDGQGSQMGGMPAVDLRMFEHESQPVGTYYGGGSGQLISPSFSYAEDVDMPTPSTGGFPTEGYHPAAQHPDNYLRPPTGHGHGSVSTASPKSTQGEISPTYHHTYIDDTSNNSTRPNLSRSVTAQEPLQSTAIKHSGSSDDDGDYVPAEGSKGGRGRKRQRIPHTAVERRYRENLNAHLDKLRQSVPSLAARPTGKGSGANQEGVKPSKCEVLNGAIEHIATLDKENQELRDDVKMLRARIEEMERWHRNNSRSSSYGV